MTNLKIAVVTPAIRPGGGPAGYTYNLREGVRKNNRKANPKVEYDFVSALSDERTQSGGANASRLQRAARAANRVSFGAVRSTTSLIQQLAPSNRRRIREADIVVLQGYQSRWSIRLAGRRRTPLVYMPHSPTPMFLEIEMNSALSRKGSAASRIEITRARLNERSLLNSATNLVFPSPGAMTEYVNEFGIEIASKPVHFIASGVSMPSHIRADRAKQVAPTVFFAGRYADHKGYDIFCDAATILTGEGVNADFASLGSGPQVPAAVVNNLGWSQEPHIQLASAALVVVPNRVAYFDLLPLEVAALGIGLVFTPVGGNVEQARCLPDSVMAKSTSPSDVADAIKLGLAEVAKNRLWGSRNVDVYNEQFTDIAMAARWNDLLAELHRRQATHGYPPKHD